MPLYSNKTQKDNSSALVRESFCNLHVAEILFLFLVMLSLLPYLRTSPMGSDTQPHFALFLFLFVLLSASLNLRIPLGYPALMLGAFYSLLAIILKASFTEVFSIFLLFISVSVFVAYGKRYMGMVRIAVAISTTLYMFFCVVEYLWGRELIELIVSNTRTSEGRGFTSLTSEPSFLGLVSLAHIVVLQVVKGSLYRLFQLIAFMSLLLSGSVAVIAPAFLVVAFYLSSVFGFRGIVAVVILGGAGIYLLYSVGGRASELIDLMFSDPAVLILDQSFANRVARSFGPLVVAFNDYLVPHRFTDISHSINAAKYLLGVPHSDEVTRLSNISTVFLYGFGVFSLPVAVWYFYHLRRMRTPLYLFVAILYFLISNVSVAVPYIAMILALPFWVDDRYQVRNIR